MGNCPIKTHMALSGPMLEASVMPGRVSGAATAEVEFGRVYKPHIPWSPGEVVFTCVHSFIIFHESYTVPIYRSSKYATCLPLMDDTYEHLHSWKIYPLRLQSV